MKRLSITILAILCIALTSCQGKKEKQIQASVNENAMGNDLNYSPGKLKKVKTVKLIDAKKNLNAFLGRNDKDVDVMLNGIEGGIQQARQKNSSEQMKIWKFYKKRLKALKKTDKPGKTSYTVYKHNYTIKNEMLGDEKIKVTNYYFFSPKEKLLGHVGKSEHDRKKDQYVQTETIAYDMMLKDSN